MSDHKTVNVSDLIDGRGLSRYQIGIFVLCALAALMDGYDSVIVGITAPAIAQSLTLDVKTFGPIFSAAQLGFMISAFIAGYMADRFGRKTVLVASVAVFGLFSLLTPLSSSFEALVLYRFLTGIGLGGASVSFISLSTEFAPMRIRATIVSTMWTMMPLGSVVGGVVAAAILPTYGWEHIYIIGGVLPMMIALLMWLLVPESISFVASRGRDDGRLSRIARRIAPDLQLGRDTQFIIAEERSGGSGVFSLFRQGRTKVTLCLWVAFFCCWLVLVTMVAWIVPILEEAGIPSSQAPLMVSLFAGGTLIGSPIVGRIMDKFDLYSVLIVFLLLAMIMVSTLGFFMGSMEMFAVGTLLGGAAVGGASSGLVALVAASYPVSIRSTGIGFAIGMARLGGTVGPVFAGSLLSAGASLHSFFLSMGAVALIAALSLLALRRHTSGNARLEVAGVGSA